MAVYPSAINLSISTGTTTSWVDISNRVVSDYEAEMGMSDESYETRLADPGRLSFDLDNDDGTYTPSAYFGKGTKVKVEFTYDSLTRTKFYGTIDEAEPDVGTSGDQFVHIVCTDWLQYPMEQFVREREVETNKRMDEGIEGLLEDMPIPPPSTSIDEGNTVFPTIYDQVDRDTTVYQEFNNIILSEYGYMYMDRGGERLRVENKNTRGGIPSLSELPSSEGGFLKLASGTNRYLELIGGGRLQLRPTYQAIFSGTFTAEPDNPKIVHGKHILNEVEFIVYPKEVDSSNVTLFNLEEPIFIPELATKRFTGFFSDPNSGQQIGGTALVALMTGTHYSAYQYPAAGSGTNYTNNMSFSVIPKVNCAVYEVTNLGAGAWLTTLIQQGKGIYPYSPINYIATDSASKNQYGVKSLSIRQPYQQTLQLGEEEAEKILDIEREGRNIVIRAKINANASDLLMQAFMHLDIGSLVQIINTKPAVNSYYFINGIRWRSIKGGSIDVVWICKEMPSFSPVAVDFMGEQAGSQNGVDYGKPDILSNLNQVSFTIDINLKNPVTQTSILMGKYTSTAQKVLSLHPGGVVRFTQLFTGNDGVWRATVPILTGTAPVDRWIRLGVTYDASNIANDPSIYITGSSVSLTEEVTPSGVAEDDANARFIIGNAAYTSVVEWVYRPDWVYRNARVYNRVLSATEMATLAANLNNYDVVTEGLIFNTPFVRNFRYPGLVDTAMTTESKVFDRVNQLVGVPHYTIVTGTSHQPYWRDPSDSSY